MILIVRFEGLKGFSFVSCLIHRIGSQRIFFAEILTALNLKNFLHPIESFLDWGSFSYGSWLISRIQILKKIPKDSFALLFGGNAHLHKPLTTVPFVFYGMC